MKIIMALILKNFWTWAGTVILVAVVLNGAAEIIKAARKPRRKVRRTTYGDRTCILEIENAGPEDVEHVINGTNGKDCVVDTDWRADK